MPTIHLDLNQSILKGGQRLPLALAHRTTDAVALALSKNPPPKGGRGVWLVSVAFVGPKQMQSINRHYRGKDRLTDVLSFPLQNPPAKGGRGGAAEWGQGGRGVVGEVLISYDQARRQALERGHATRDEVVFLLVHGLLHLFGFDHERPVDAKQMFPLQERILKSLSIDSRL
ncbi:rRNA maturation RNase YbeY [Candidatus Uhrbacteria bacterium]|nr:rRNA maturation RNase YbeY [Candidatus Uhrbacteria bacterium]